MRRARSGSSYFLCFLDTFGVFAASSFAIFCRTASVMRGNNAGGDGEQIGGEVGLVFELCVRTENHEFSASFLKQELQQLESDSRKPISAHDHNLGDHSFEDVFQKGAQTLSVEVDAGADVSADDVVRERFLEVRDLAVEVCVLLGATNSGVDVGVLGRTWLLSEESKHGVLVVHPLPSMEFEELDVSGGRPVPKGGGTDAILVVEMNGRFEGNFGSQGKSVQEESQKI